ncbi:MAG: Transcriptional regulator, TrmB [Candidatus Uhrbacteria bacterium GW2011_GWA2_53_10]|uniref:Transcriptional regulator, TrmB n=1 Tax=Candidatus Uhrbacteria bacterium GW2011_GWA2_53_10 TaxID=1618980 RepID=A0A0G1XPK3_9BACT|nr:MAG: Transcriptional regulator, TrmB [Candidatus Uhrbacteria bacterium GW2011_GWA2_53_10]
MELKQALEQYGFTKNETSIYIYLLKYIEATAFGIAKATDVPRSTVYITLESLKKQGFIFQFKKNNVAYFTAESPNRLINALKQKEGIIESIMPEIRALTAKNIDAPVAKLHTGINGIKIGLEDILETLKDKKIKQIFATSQPELLEYLPKYFPNWLKQREDLGVFTKLILPASASEYLKSNALREVRYLNKKFPFTCSVTIYGNKIAFFSFENGEPYCLIVKSKAVSDTFTQFFLFSWEMLESKTVE